MTTLNLPDGSLPGSPPSLLPASRDSTNKNLSKSLAFYKNLEVQKELVVAYATLVNAWGFDGETTEELVRFCEWFEELYSTVVDLANMDVLSEDTRRIALTACADILTIHHIPHEPHLYLVVALRRVLIPSSKWQDWDDWPRNVQDLWGMHRYDATGQDLSGAAGEAAVLQDTR